MRYIQHTWLCFAVACLRAVGSFQTVSGRRLYCCSRSLFIERQLVLIALNTKYVFTQNGLSLPLLGVA